MYFLYLPFPLIFRSSKEASIFNLKMISGKKSNPNGTLSSQNEQKNGKID